MFKRIAIMLVSTILLALIVGAINLYVTGGPNSDTTSDLIKQTAYLTKSKESYARCYNSTNYGTSLIGDVRLTIKGENFNDDSVTSERLDIIENSFMNTIKDECQKKVDDYQQAYDRAIEDQEEINSPSNALWKFLFGFTQTQPSFQDLSLYSPALARTTVAFNDYVFTDQQVKTYFEKELGL